MSSPSSGGPPGSQYFSLRWNNHPSNLVSVFSGLYTSETLVDVTLAAEGKHIQAHKMLLSACSDYFQSLFSVNPCQHPIVILKDVQFEDLETVVQFMYNGVVNVSSEKLPAVLKTADTLQIKGLGEKFTESVNQAMGSGSNSADVPSPRLLSVPSQHSVTSNHRQQSTESLPDFFQRARSFSPLQATTDSQRQYSIESTVSALVRKHPTPPASPPRHYRKKFRKMSAEGSSSERGNSIEDPRLTTPPTIHLSPTRQSSSSTDHDSGMVVAKKKRELFSARSSRSGGSNKSSVSEYSREQALKPQDSSTSSGHSQSQDDAAQASISTLTTTTAAAASGATSVVPTATSANSLTTTSSSGPSLLIPSRTLSRTQSAGETNQEAVQAAPAHKRGRFLKRQDCLEKGMDLTTDGGSSAEHDSSASGAVRSSPNSPLMGTSSSIYPGMGSPATDSKSGIHQRQGSADEPSSVSTSCVSSSSSSHQQIALVKQKSQPPLSLPHYFPVDNPPPPPPSHHQHHHLMVPPPANPLSHKLLPSVRVTPDASEMDVSPIALDRPHHQRLHPVPNMRLLYPPEFGDGRRPLIKSRSTDSSFSRTYDLSTHHHHPMSGHPLSRSYDQASGSSNMGTSGSTFVSAPSTSSEGTPDVLSLSSQVSDQFGHCPKAREGPALGCNYCWNTTDSNGRILRRKTKYHCPECQANLCIVPCFQQYHEALERDKRMSSPRS